MTAPAVQVPQLSAEEVARIRAAWQAFGRQLREVFDAVGRALAELFRQIGKALRPLLRVLVRPADQRRVRLRVMHLAYRRRLRNRRRRGR